MHSMRNEALFENILLCCNELKLQKVKQLRLPCFQLHHQVSKRARFTTCDSDLSCFANLPCSSLSLWVQTIFHSFIVLKPYVIKKKKKPSL